MHTALEVPLTSWCPCHTALMPRFLTLADVTEVLNISMAQAYKLVHSGELPALQIGGQGKAGQWRVEVDELEAYIQRMYAQTRARIEAGTETGPELDDRRSASEAADQQKR